MVTRYDDNIPLENITGRETEGLPELLRFELFDPSGPEYLDDNPDYGGNWYAEEKRIHDCMEMAQVEADARNSELRSQGSDLRWITRKQDRNV